MLVTGLGSEYLATRPDYGATATWQTSQNGYGTNVRVTMGG